MTKGSGLQANVVEHILQNGYRDKKVQREIVDGFYRDNDLSGNRVQVYQNPNTKQVIVSHRGTSGLLDWANNLSFINGVYKLTPRFRHAKDIQEKAEGKYGNDNEIYTMGHSQGAMLAKELGKKSREIIALDRPVLLRETLHEKTPENLVDIRTKHDLVSGLVPYQRRSSSSTKNGELITIPSHSYDPIAEHHVNKMDNLGDKMLGGAGSDSRKL